MDKIENLTNFYLLFFLPKLMNLELAKKEIRINSIIKEQSWFYDSPAQLQNQLLVSNGKWLRFASAIGTLRKKLTNANILTL